MDELRWLPVDEAAQLLTYPYDRDVLTAFRELPLHTTTVLLVRHAKAGKRGELDGNMTAAAQALSDQDIEVLADYIAALGS